MKKKRPNQSGWKNLLSIHFNAFRPFKLTHCTFLLWGQWQARSQGVFAWLPASQPAGYNLSERPSSPIQVMDPIIRLTRETIALYGMFGGIEKFSALIEPDELEAPQILHESHCSQLNSSHFNSPFAIIIDFTNLTKEESCSLAFSAPFSGLTPKSCLPILYSEASPT